LQRLRQRRLSQIVYSAIYLNLKAARNLQAALMFNDSSIIDLAGLRVLLFLLIT
jgi:hypothetical protein